MNKDECKDCITRKFLDSLNIKEEIKKEHEEYNCENCKIKKTKE